MFHPTFPRAERIDDSSSDLVSIATDYDDEPCAVLRVFHADPDIERDIADRIVRAVNHHADLVQALRTIATFDPTQWDAATLGNIARSALAKLGD